MPFIPFDKIEVDDESNARKTYKGIRELADGIKSVGLLEPLITLKKNSSGKYKLRAGYRRHRALSLIRKEDPKLFRQKFQQVEVTFKGEDKESESLINLTENTQRQDLTPGEIANDVSQRITEKGNTIKKIATAIGFSPTYVSNLIKCRKELHEKAFEEFMSGNLPVDMAIKMAAMPHEKQLAFLKKYLAAKESVNGKQAASKAGRDAATEFTDGKPTVRKLESVIEEIAESSAEDPYWAGVVHGLEFATGKRKSFKNPDIKKKGMG